MIGFVSGAVIVLIVGGALWLLIGPQLSSLGTQAARVGGAPARTFSAQETRGEALYNANCMSCHGGPMVGATTDYPPRHNASGHTWHHPDCQLKQIVRDGSDEMTDMMREMMAPPDAPRMQAFKDRLSDEEIEAVLAYIKTMWAPAQREIQAEITHEACAA